ncbi:uncharacterized protein BX663DRAFT_529949 [Cokeromyces recurvatus]|uniref:uncharacterized protein n=1 Tax=Cokeromyces recurvatus TaxID=90255 RepID=UPI00221F743D|nr:uncharacterized protein BX663DRAFT_529949 [Cokeromyces recurvatus]KAI7905075.1 hypothetical protein BX663DRAFT_529949 [Cokeromyces recurvatus]
MSMAPSKQAVIQAYRSLLRTQRQVFDTARRETYNRFMQYKNETNIDILEEKLQLAKQVETLLKRMLFKAYFTIELRITKDTELGDNDSIKKTKNINRQKKNGCCGKH